MFPIVAPEAISQVINIYPVVAEVIAWEVKLGNTLVPATPGFVNVLNKPSVEVFKVASAEYQHLIFVISVAKYVPAVVTWTPVKVAFAKVTATENLCKICAGVPWKALAAITCVPLSAKTTFGIGVPEPWIEKL